ncbi:MAG TPA: alpha/beta fold hydrolase [Blastocatellia bacterium]
MSVEKKEKYIPAMGFDLLTPLYDSFVKWFMPESRFKKHLIEQANIRPGQRVLDLGCGTATLTIMIKQAHPNAEVTGLDGDAKILRIARRKVVRAGVEIALHEGLACRLPYSDKSFDRVVSSLMFHHLTAEGRRRALSEAFRVLQPGGELHIADLGRPNKLLPEMLREAGFEQYEEFCRYATIFGDLLLWRARRPLEEAPLRFSVADGMRRTLSTDGAAPSWQSRCLNGLLRLLPFKKRWASAAAVQERARRLALRPASYEPVGLGSGVEVTLKKSVEGWPIYYTAPSATPDSGAYALFLHGGGYINEIVRAHWRFVAYLTRKAGVRCVVPIYPLAPRATAKYVVPATGALLRDLLDDVGPGNVTVVGNSAGGGLGLAAVQWLRDSGYRQPKALALITPFLDVSISRPEQREIAARDPMEDIPGLIEAGRLYAGDLDVANPYVSPLNGDMRGLAPMIVFSGTLDLLYPDSIDLAAKARAAGVPIEFHLRQGQPHNYALMPTPEGREARAIILRAVAQGLT